MIIDERLSVFIDALQWNLPGELAELEQQALEDQVPIIRRPMQTFLGFILGMTQPASILEIGTAVGFSGILMSEYVPEQTSITTIEKVPARIRAAKANFVRYGKEDRICLLEGDAAEVLEKLCAQGNQYDFIFMDAAKGQYLNFLPDLNIYLFNWLMFWYRNRLTAAFSKCIMTASAFGRIHFIAITFQYFSQFIKA